MLDFNSRNYKRWKKPFDLLELILILSIDIGDETQNEIDTDLINILRRLHARSCLVTNEILCLLKAGFPDGAQSRWRTLHEIAVISMFLNKYGEKAASMYIDYSIVEEYQVLLKEKEFMEYTGSEIDEKELDEYVKIYDSMIVKYGKTFKRSYGWAYPFLNEKNVTFEKIEKSLGLDHWRPSYKYASHNTHASIHGTLYKLGLKETEKEVLLVGPSNSGMVMPLHATAISLNQVTMTLLLLDSSNFDNIVLGDTLIKIQEKIAEEVILCDKKSIEKNR